MLFELLDNSLTKRNFFKTAQHLSKIDKRHFGSNPMNEE